MKTTLLSFILMISALAVQAQNCALSSRQFFYKLREIENTHSIERQMKIAVSVANEYCLYSNQVQQLASALPNDALRIEFGELAYDHVLDPANFYDVYDAFDSFSMAFRLHDLINDIGINTVNNHPRGPRGPRGPRNPDNHYVEPVLHEAPIICGVSPTEFAQIKLSLQNKSFSNEKLRFAQLIAKDHHFTVSQIRELSRTYRIGFDHVAFIKTFYANCLDKRNYYLLVDELTFMSEKNELMDFIQRQHV